MNVHWKHSYLPKVFVNNNINCQPQQLNNTELIEYTGLMFMASDI